MLRVLIGFMFANAITCVVCLAVSSLIGSFLWPYAINEWLLFAGREASVTWQHGAIIGLVPGLGLACVPLSVLTWIAMLFLAASPAVTG